MTADELRAVFDAPAPYTVGLEEEVMLVDPLTLERADQASRRRRDGQARDAGLAGGGRDRARARVGEAIAELRAGASNPPRARTAIAAGTHPLAPPVASLNTGERYDAILAQYATPPAQLVCSLQVHVALGSAELTLPSTTRSAATFPSSPRWPPTRRSTPGATPASPRCARSSRALLPRQGIPPEIPSWEAFAEMLAWAGDPKTWWFELRPHLRYGTLELRVCDSQTTLGRGRRDAAFVHALVVWLAERGGGPVRQDGGSPRTASSPPATGSTPSSSTSTPAHAGRCARCSPNGSRRSPPWPSGWAAREELATAVARDQRRAAASAPSASTA